MNLRSTLVMALLLAAGSAHAQAPKPDPAADAALSEGRRLYDLQEWDQAIAKFKEAYRLRADAAALFNIAQSYRLKGDCQSAASFYRTYKRNFAKEKNIDKVEKFITEMEACAKAGTKPVDPVKPDPVKPDPVKPDPVKPDPVKPDPVKPVTPDPVKTDPVKPDPVKPDPVKPDPVKPDLVTTTVTTDPGGGSISTPMPPPENKGGTLKIAGLVVVGVGVVGVGLGVVFGVRARSAAADAEAIGNGMWKPAIEERGEKAEKNAKLFLAIGGAAVVTGGVLYFLGAKKSNESSSVSFVPTRDGASLAWTSDF